MRVAPGIDVVHLAGASNAMSATTDGETIELRNETGAVGLVIRPDDEGGTTSVTVTPHRGDARLDGELVGSALTWRPGSVLRLGADAWRLDTEEPLPMPLADDRPLRARRVPLVEPTDDGRLGRLLRPGRRRQRDEERAAALADARQALTVDLDERGRRLAARERPRVPSGLEVVVGVGDRWWRPEVVHGPHTGWDPTPLADTPRPLPSVPIIADLADGPLAVVGTTPTSRDLVRALVLQLCERGAVGAVVGPASSPWRWMAALDAFCPRPADHDRRDLLVVTERTEGVHDGPTILVVPDAASLAGAAHAAAVDVGAGGLATVTDPSGERIASAVAPCRRSAADVLGRPDAPDAGPERGMVAFSAPELDNANELLASLVIDLAKRCEPSELAVFVIDEVRRPLVRLRQIPHVQGYVSLDDLDGVADVVARAETAEGFDRVVLAVADLPEVDLHLRRRGGEETFRRLVRLAAATDHRHLTVAASCSSDHRPHAALGAATGPRVQRINGTAIVADDRGRRTIELSHPSGRDLTGAVAGLRDAAVRH